MNPFSPHYKPQIDLGKDAVERKISATRSRQRAEGMASDDPAVRKQARGTIGNGKLSGRGGRKA